MAYDLRFVTEKDSEAKVRRYLDQKLLYSSGERD